MGPNAAAKSPKDGYTLFLGSASSLGYGKLPNKDLPDDPVKDFTPLIQAGTVPIGIFVNASSDIRTLQDLISAARARPGALTFATPGMGGVTHVAMEILMNRACIELTHVPYSAGHLLDRPDRRHHHPDGGRRHHRRPAAGEAVAACA